MKRFILTAAFVFGMVLHVQAYTEVWNDIRRPLRSAAELDSALHTDASECDREVGAPKELVSAKYKKCMLTHNWKYSHTSKTPAAPTDFSPDPPGYRCWDIEIMGVVTRRCEHQY
jgi:hypothetical protein